VGGAATYFSLAAAAAGAVPAVVLTACSDRSTRFLRSGLHDSALRIVALTEDIRFLLKYGPDLGLDYFSYELGELLADSISSRRFAELVREEIAQARGSVLHLCPLPPHLLGVATRALRETPC